MTKRKPATVHFHLDIVWKHRSWARYKKELEPRIHEILLAAAAHIKNFPKKNHDICIIMTGDDDIQEVNLQHRGKNKPTNVLSFPQYHSLDEIKHSKDPVLMLGDIILSYQTLRRECAAEKKSFEDHFTHLTLHGFLHLLGYDHENDDDATAMENMEIKILRTLGVKNPYSHEL